MQYKTKIHLVLIIILIIRIYIMYQMTVCFVNFVSSGHFDYRFWLWGALGFAWIAIYEKLNSQLPKREDQISTRENRDSSFEGEK